MPLENNSPRIFFVVRKLDPKTHCWLQQAKFYVTDLAELSKTVEGDWPEQFSAKEIDSDAYCRIVTKYSLPIDIQAVAAELEHQYDGKELDSRTRTGRELLLMLGGLKPLAAFVEVHPDDVGLEIFPETRFNPFVESGRISKCEYRISTNESATRCLRRVLYALPGQEWRFRAHQMLWLMAHKHGWNSGFETVEGFLLGHETQVDPFFNCENECSHNSDQQDHTPRLWHR
jgi:hypothetical protein